MPRVEDQGNLPWFGRLVCAAGSGSLALIF